MSISTTLNLTGNMAAQLERIARSATTARVALESVGRVNFNSHLTAVNALNGSLRQTVATATGAAETLRTTMTGATTALSTATQNAVTQVSNLTGQLQSVERQTNRNTQAQQRHTRSIHEGDTVVSSMLTRMMTLAAIYGSMSGVKEMFNISDTEAQIRGGIELIIDKDSLNKANGDMQVAVENMRQQIMSVANETRASYTDTAKFITKLGINARDAFSGNAELLRFSEQLNKAFIVASTSAKEMSATLTQLPQALSKGVLNGDELTSIMENAPLVGKIIESYAHEVEGLSGSLKEMGKNGDLTSRTIVNAMAWAAEDTDAKFAKMPFTWAQRWQIAINGLINKLSPISKAMNDLANVDGTTKGLEQLMNTVATLGAGLLVVTSLATSFFGMLAEGGAIQPLIMGFVTLAGVLGLVAIRNMAVGIAAEFALGAESKSLVVQTAMIAKMAILNGMKTYSIILTNLHAVADVRGVGAKAAYIATVIFQTLAEQKNIVTKTILIGLMTAGSVVMGILAVGYALYNGCVTMATIGDAMHSAAIAIKTGLMTILNLAMLKTVITTLLLHAATIGIIIVIAVLAVQILSAVLSFLKLQSGARTALGAVAYYFGLLGATIYNIIADVWNLFLDFASFLGNVWSDPLNAGIKMFVDFGTAVINIISRVASAVDGILGTNFSGFLNGLSSAVSEWGAKQLEGYTPKYDLRADFGLENVDAMEIAHKFGEQGDKASDAIGKMMSDIKKGLEPAELGDMPSGMSPADSDALDKTKDNTGRMAKTLDKTAEDLSELRKWNEARFIAKSTTLSIPIAPHVNVTNQSVDGVVHNVVGQIEDVLREAILTGSEGLHA